MKKLTLLIIFIMNIGFVFCQETMGSDNNPILNKSESVFFNSFLKEQKKDFDFTTKKIAFVSLDWEISPKSKNDYFLYYYFRNSDTISCCYLDFLVLDSIQKIKSEGYDAIIFINKEKKDLTEKRINRTIEKLTECENRKPFGLYSLGLDNNPILTEEESRYFKDKKPDYDFTNKTVGFFKGNNGSSLQTKNEYFNQVKNRLGNNLDGSMDFIINLSNEEKIRSGGYDFIIVSWSKILVDSATKKMINKLKKIK